jgi:hypothetical protein
MRKTLAGVLMICLGMPTGIFAQHSAGTDALTQPVAVSSEVVAFTPLQAATNNTAAGSQRATVVRDDVRKLGLGKKVRLRTVKDEEVRGRITSIADDTFTVDGGQPRVIAYADVSTLKRQGMAGWKKGLIIGGIAFGALMLIGALAIAAQDGFQ